TVRCVRVAVSYARAVPRPASRAILAAFVAALVLVLAACGGSSAKKHEVPSVSGQTIDQALQQLQGAGFDVGLTGQQNDAPPATVRSQSPASGSSADEGSTVTLTVSTGPGQAPVPSVVGRSQDDATAALQQAGFVPDVADHSSSAPAGQVFEQSPAAGAQV